MGCSASQPQQEISSAFTTFLADVRAGNQEKVLAAAPFLASLPTAQREAALQTFQSLAAEDAALLRMQVAPGAQGTYVLQVSVRGGAAGIVVPFHKNDHGTWEMSPLVEMIQHIDIVPAQKE